MLKTTARQFGYLEGLRIARNHLRKQVKSAKLLWEKANQRTLEGEINDTNEAHEKGAFDQAVRLKIKMEEFYTRERKRLFDKNNELKKKYLLCIQNNKEIIL